MQREDNEFLTRTGPGTPMGELFRRYWIPALSADDLSSRDCAPVRVRLLGENLVAFRDTGGQVALITEGCPHRGASLFLGRNEEYGLRCIGRLLATGHLAYSGGLGTMPIVAAHAFDSTGSFTAGFIVNSVMTWLAVFALLGIGKRGSRTILPM